MAEQPAIEAPDDYLPEDELDESLLERVFGLNEMLPEFLRKGVSKTCSVTGACLKKVYGFSRTYAWIFFSSATILIVPIGLQQELHSMEEMAKAQQRQMLLGPNAAYSR